MSPATRSRKAISCGFRSVAAEAAIASAALVSAPLTTAGVACERRITVAVLLTIARRLSAARCERPSWTNRMTVLSATITPITTVALASPLRDDSSASTVSSTLNGLR